MLYGQPGMSNLGGMIMKPIHPGDVLLEVYMKPPNPGLTEEVLSQTLGIPEQVLSGFISGRRSMTPSLANKLSVVCRTTPAYWLQLQRGYERQIAKHRGARRHDVNGTHNDHPAAAA